MTNTRFYYLISRFRNLRRHKDNLFCTLFNEEKQGLLELYNALNGTSHTDVGALEIVTIQSSLYITYRDDVAYLMNGTINLYEHQSTRNPNMPVRFLIYLATEYQKLIEANDRNIYGSSIITLPKPKCVVFYNGSDDVADYDEMRLSDAFNSREQDSGIEADAELIVHVYNINTGHNRNIMEKCPTLAGYVYLIDKIDRYKKTMLVHKAVERAISECIDEGVLETFLRRHRAEVLGMVLFNNDKKKYWQAVRDDAREAGLEEGRAEGREEGRAEGHEEGRAEGREEGRAEGIQIGIVISLHNAGEPADRIAAQTHKTLDEINAIIKEYNS